MKSSVFWNITSCSPLKVCRHFEGTLLLLTTACFTLVSCLTYSSSLKMEASCSSETSLHFQRTIYLYLWLYIPFCWTLAFFFSFLILYTVGMTPWSRDQPVARPLPTHRRTQTQNKRTQTSMPWVGFEPPIPAFERAKAFHALDRAATVIGTMRFKGINFRAV
jgi:hypothetical protein